MFQSNAFQPNAFEIGSAVTGGGGTNYTLSGAAGAYSITGQAGTFKAAYSFAGSAGSYLITGQSATLTYTDNGRKNYTLSGEFGSYTITGSSGQFGYTDKSTPTKIGGDDAPHGYKKRFQVQVKNKVHLFETDEQAQAFLKSLKKPQKAKAIVKPDPAYEAMMKNIMDEMDDEDVLLLLL